MKARTAKPRRKRWQAGDEKGQIIVIWGLPILAILGSLYHLAVWYAIAAWPLEVRAAVVSGNYWKTNYHVTYRYQVGYTAYCGLEAISGGGRIDDGETLQAVCSSRIPAVSTLDLPNLEHRVKVLLGIALAFSSVAGTLTILIWRAPKRSGSD